MTITAAGSTATESTVDISKDNGDVLTTLVPTSTLIPNQVYLLPAASASSSVTNAKNSKPKQKVLQSFNPFKKKH